MKHYLVSVPLSGGYVHGYVMTNDKQILLCVADQLIDEAEKRGLRCWPPIILETRLDTGWKTVREIIAKNHSEPAEHWKTVKDFHLTAWFTSDRDPDQRRLLDLH